MNAIRNKLISLALATSTLLGSGSAFASEPTAEQNEEYAATEQKLVVGTAASGGTAAFFLLLGVALHAAAGSAANDCATEILDNAQSGVVSTCDEQIDKVHNRIVGRDIAFVGFGIAAIATIVTGAMLGVHRSRGPERFTFTGTGMRLRF